MNLLSRPSQFKTLSGFCNDLAKGLVLAAVIGQGSIEKANIFSRILLAGSWFIFALLFLYFALTLSRYEQ